MLGFPPLQFVCVLFCAVEEVYSGADGTAGAQSESVYARKGNGV